MTYSERKELAFEYFEKRWKNADIARMLDVTPETISNYKREWKKYNEEAAWEDPNYLNKILEHTKARVNDIDMVVKSLWKMVDTMGEGQAKVSALRTIKDAIMDISKLQRLLDQRIEIVDQAEKANATQAIILEMINIIIDDCPSCKAKLAGRLAEAQELRGGPTLALRSGVTIDSEVIE